MITVIILTHNETRHIARALNSVRDIAKEIFVVDSGSTDDTKEISKSFGAVVLENAWVSHAVQFQWAMDNAPITSDWVMRLDADEVIEQDLVDAIQKQLPLLGPEITGVRFNRRHIFMGKWIRHGGRYPVTLLRLWRHGTASMEDRWMDEHIHLTLGRSIVLPGGFSDINLNDLSFFTEKHNKYATKEAIEILNQRYHLFSREKNLEGERGGQAELKRSIKESIYNKLPFGVGPTLYFLYRYFVQLGFLDGPEGAIYHYLQGYWYRFLVDAKTMELDREIRFLQTNKEKLARLAMLTGLKL